MRNYLFTIFGRPVTFYGILVMLGALAAAFLAARQAKKRGQDPETIWDMFAWVLLAGIIGARLWHIFTPPPSMVAQGMTTMWYLTHPIEMIQIWDGGLGIPGAIIGGGLALYIYTRIKKLDFGMWADFAAPGLALAQAIGRWGNFFNQELYGKPSTLPWAITIDPEYRLPEYRLIETYHPLFLYESIWNLLNMGVLLFLGKRFEKWLKNGDIFLIYLMAYGVGRFLLEFLRLDAAQVGGINFNQTVMAIVTLASAGLFLWRHSKYASAPARKAALVVEDTKKRVIKPALKGSTTLDAAKPTVKRTSSLKATKASAEKSNAKKVVKSGVKPVVKRTTKTTAKTTARKSVKAK
jgi:phosphatidylglycerol:prolipoprotein diacylglycerol transferase